MIPWKRKKRQALLSEDPERMQEMMQTQQAAMMRLRLAEEKRIQYQKDAGFGHLAGGRNSGAGPARAKGIFAGLLPGFAAGSRTAAGL